MATRGDTSSLSLQEVVKKLDHVAEMMQKMTELMTQREANIDNVVETKVNQYMEEKDEREKRECNIILHNIAESDSDETDERKKHDTSKVEEVLGYLKIANPQETMKPIRLGKKLDTNKPRLMKITLESVEIQKHVLAKAKSLKDSSDKELKNVYISPDLTLKERE
jgi:hypothetical protein